MKCLRLLLLLRLLLCCVAGCGRVGYELLPDDSNSALHDADADGAATDADDSATPEDADAGDDAGVSDAASSDDASTHDDASTREDASTHEDASTVEDAASPGDAARGEDAAMLGDGAAFDAGGASDAAPDAALDDGAVSDTGSGGDDSLVLRYDFSGTGTTVPDRVGTGDGRLLGGAQLDGSGGVMLDGVDDFVDLPNGLISNLTSVTIVAWLDWAGGPCWQRVFDFGSSSAGEGNAGNATSALSVTTASCGENVVTVLVELDGQLWATNGTALATGRTSQVALVVDGVAAQLRLYVDGAQVAQIAMPIRLDQLRDENNWLGRSQWVQDRYLRARYDELRIYDRPLSAAEISGLHARGPDLP